MNEREKLCITVDEFAEEMKKRLLQKQKEGFTGWDDKNVCLEGIAARLFYKSSETYTILNFSQKKNLRKKILVDIANFAMMIWRKL